MIDINIFQALGAFFAAIGINPTHLSAGLAGSLVRAIVLKARSKLELMSTGLVGTLCASYFTPIIVKWIEMDPDTTNGVAFGIGLIGMSLAEGFLRMAHKWSENPQLPTEVSMKGFADAVNPSVIPVETPAQPEPVEQQLELPIDPPKPKPRKPRKPRQPKPDGCP